MSGRSCSFVCELLDDFEGSALTVTGGGAGQQSSDRLNRLTITTDHPPHIALPELKSKDCCFATRNFGQHHLVGKFDKLADDKLEKFFHYKTFRRRNCRRQE